MGVPVRSSECSNWKLSSRRFLASLELWFFKPGWIGIKLKVLCQRLEIAIKSNVVIVLNDHLKIVILTMSFVHDKNFPFDSRKLLEIIRYEHLRSSDHNFYHPAPHPRSPPFLLNLIQIPLVEADIVQINLVCGEREFISTASRPIICWTMIHNCVEICPTGKFSVPVGNCGKGCNNKERSSGRKLWCNCTDVSGCLNGFAGDYWSIKSNIFMLAVCINLLHLIVMYVLTLAPFHLPK